MHLKSYSYNRIIYYKKNLNKVILRGAKKILGFELFSWQNVRQKKTY
jgi:hypothetical protein